MRISAIDFKDLLHRWSELMQAQRAYLIEIDSVVGDADLGLTMSAGFLAAYNAVKDESETDIGKLAYFAGKAMSTAVPSTMGTLLSQGFMSAGKALRGKEELSDQDAAVFFTEFYNGVQKLGQAKPGEKTFLDGLTSTIKLLNEGTAAGSTLEEIAPQLPPAAEKDLAATQDMVAKHGRAATRGEASRALVDPGATVAKMLVAEFAEFVLSK